MVASGRSLAVDVAEGSELWEIRRTFDKQAGCKVVLLSDNNRPMDGSAPSRNQVCSFNLDIDEHKNMVDSIWEKDFGEDFCFKMYSHSKIAKDGQLEVKTNPFLIDRLEGTKTQSGESAMHYLKRAAQRGTLRWQS